MPWIITKDFIADAGTRAPSNSNAVGLVGPSHAKLTGEQIVAHPEGSAFRMKDGDGEVYYEGIMVITAEDGDGAEFRPLDDFGRPSAGAVDIEYRRDNGTWELM